MADRERTSSNSDLARIVAEVADALAEYDHLPPLQFVMVTRTGKGRARPSGFGHEELVALVEWANAFGSPVIFDRSDVSSIGAINVRTIVPLASQAVQLTVMLSDVTKLDALALQAGGVAPFGTHVEVSAEALLAVLDGERATA